MNETEKENPLISIIIPIYNGEKFLKETLQSVVDQTYTNWECFVINDIKTSEESNKKQQEICDSFNDSRLDYVQNPTRINHVPSNRNYAIFNLTKGLYVATLDGDDIWKKNKLEKQIPYMIKNDLYLCGTWYSEIDENHNFVKNVKTKWRTKNKIILRLFRWNPFSCPSVIIHKKCFEIVGGFDYKLPLACDYDMWTRIAPLFNTEIMPEILTEYRVLANSTSRNKNIYKEGIWIIYKYFISMLFIHTKILFKSIISLLK